MGSGRVKVDNVLMNRALAHEFDTRHLAHTQMFPEFDSGICHIFAQCSGAFC
jgi:hypothetical protein